MDNKGMENNQRLFRLQLQSNAKQNSICGKQKNGKQKWKTNTTKIITYLQVK